MTEVPASFALGLRLGLPPWVLPCRLALLPLSRRPLLARHLRRRRRFELRCAPVHILTARPPVHYLTEFAWLRPGSAGPSFALSSLGATAAAVTAPCSPCGSASRCSTAMCSGAGAPVHAAAASQCCSLVRPPALARRVALRTSLSLQAYVGRSLQTCVAGRFLGAATYSTKGWPLAVRVAGCPLTSSPP